jgi:hypothetical protein
VYLKALKVITDLDASDIAPFDEWLKKQPAKAPEKAPTKAPEKAPTKAPEKAPAAKAKG